MVLNLISLVNLLLTAEICCWLRKSCQSVKVKTPACHEVYICILQEILWVKVPS